MPGQINLDSAFGKKLYEIAQTPAYTTFAEVGTWNGEGSTWCLVQGILRRSDQASVSLYSLEANTGMLAQAQRFYATFNFPFLHLLGGTINKTAFMSREDVTAHPRFSLVRDHYYLHYDDEHRSFSEAPFQGEQIPAQVDVVLLDGGEFSTDGDFEFFRTRNPQMWILDDVSVIKTQRVFEQLKADPAWELIDDHPQDRNGWAIFRRTT